jgi:hypothetical protein
MDDEIRFLRDAAEELRRLANLSPEIGEQLLRLAGELDAEALSRLRGWPSRPTPRALFRKTGRR